MLRILVSLLILFSFSAKLPAQSLIDEQAGVELDIQPTDVIIWSAIQANIEDDGRVAVALRLQTRNHFSIYKDRLEFAGPPGFAMIDGEFPPSHLQDDPLSDGQVEVYRGGDFIIYFDGLEQVSADSFPVSVTFLGCTERICLFPYTLEMDVPLYGATNDDFAVSADQDPAAEASLSQDVEVSPSSAAVNENPSWNDRLVAFFQGGEHSLVLLLSLAFLGGLMTNLTPCVFPMIPITLRILGGKHHKHPRINSVLYASGIIVTYTAIGSLAALSGGLFGAFLGNIYVTLFFGLLFFALGLSMLGYGNFSRLQSFGSRLGSRQSTFANVFLMGTGAGLVAAPCTGPILGALLVFTPQLENATFSLLLFFFYSAGFALPYLFLGLAANRVSQFKAPATLQVGIKALFAAVMFGLALFYLKNPIHKSLIALQGHWATMALVLTVIGFIATIYVVRHKRLAINKAALIAPSFILGLGLFAGSQWVSGADVPSQLTWYKTEAEAYRAAEELQRPILVDGWAEWCVACKQMDVTTFQDPQLVAELNAEWVLLKLDMTEFNEENESLAAKYGMPGLPTLVLLPPNGDLSESVKLTGYLAGDKLLKELRQFFRE
ncbi:MAG: cytochrome c biogenesis protein CcdA [Oligoflexus sp.]